MALFKLKGFRSVLAESLKQFESKGLQSSKSEPDLTNHTSRKKIINVNNVSLVQKGYLMRCWKTWSFLSAELNVPIREVNCQYLMTHLRKRETFVDIQLSLLFLKNYGFENSVIAESIEICFYPIQNIQRGLQWISENEEKLSNFGLINGFAKNQKPRFTNGTLLEDKRLQLCLYYLESPFGYSGQGSLAIE